MAEFNTLSILIGFIAYAVAIILGAGPVVFVAYKLDTQWPKRVKDEDQAERGESVRSLTKQDQVPDTPAGKNKHAEDQLKEGKLAVAIELGATVLCQAILIRHAVPSVMEIIRTLFVYKIPAAETLLLLGRSLLFAAFIVGFSIISVRIAGGMFTRLTKKIHEEHEIREKNNVAVAVFFALVLLAITMVLNEGMEDFSRSLIPLGRTGVID